MNQRSFAVACLSTALLVACGEESKPDGGGGDRTFDQPSFALASTVFGEAGASTYVNVLGSLDVESVDGTSATEYPQFATIAAAGGKLFVGDGAAPVATRYNVDDAGTLGKEASVSFGPRGLQTAPLYFNTFLSPDLAYVQYEQNKRVPWNPATMELQGVALETAGLDAQREGLNVISAFDRGIAVRDGLAFHPYYWTDANYYEFSASSQIAVYRAADGSLADLLDAPCPGLDVVTSDEEGNLYFSNWVFAAAAPVLDESAPATCAVRIKRGEQSIDQDWTRDLGDLVEGRQSAAFRYLGAGRAIVAVFHDERITIDENTEPSAISQASNWRLWQVNLGTSEGAPVEGLDWMAGGYYAFRFGDRTFLLLPSADYASTTAYELGKDGKAVERFTVPGWAYQFVQIR